MDMNKLKASADHIVMPEEMKERITDKCVGYAEKQIRGDSHEEHVSGVDRVGSRRISRFSAGIAACALLACGIGGTVHLLNKNAGNTGPLSGEVTSQSEAADVLSISDFFVCDFYRKTYNDVTDAQQEEIRSYVSGLTFEQSEQALDMLSGQSIEFRYNAKNAYYSVLISGGHVMYEMSVQNENDTAYHDSIFYYDTHNDSTAYDLRLILGLTEDSRELPFMDIAQIEYSYMDTSADPQRYIELQCPHYGTTEKMPCDMLSIGGEQRAMIAQLFNDCDWEQIENDIPSDLSQALTFACLTNEEYHKIAVLPDNTLCYSYHSFSRADEYQVECSADSEHIFCYRSSSETLYDDLSELMQDTVLNKAADKLAPLGELQTLSKRSDAGDDMQDYDLTDQQRAKIMLYIMQTADQYTSMSGSYVPQYTLGFKADDGTLSYVDITDGRLIVCSDAGIPQNAYLFSDTSFGWWLENCLFSSGDAYHDDAESYPPPYSEMFTDTDITLYKKSSDERKILSADECETLRKTLSGYEWKNCAENGEYTADEKMMKYVFYTTNGKDIYSFSAYSTGLIVAVVADGGSENCYYIVSDDTFALIDYAFCE